MASDHRVAQVRAGWCLMTPRFDIAIEVAAARDAGVAWKVLQRRFRLGRTALHEAGRWGARMLAAANDAAAPGAARERRSPEKMFSEHLRGCADAKASPSVAGHPPSPTGLRRTHPGHDAEGRMQGLFGGAKLPAVQPPPPVPTREDPAVEEARKKALIVARTERGREGTRLTSATGVTGQGSNTLRQTLGGA